MQQRYYDPIAGRFLSVDPVVTDAATGKQFGRYTYAENNPYARIDPDGRQSGLSGFPNVEGEFNLWQQGMIDAYKNVALMATGEGVIGIAVNAVRAWRVAEITAEVSSAVTRTASEAPAAGTGGASGELTTTSGNRYFGNSTGSSATGGNSRAPMNPQTEEALANVKNPSRNHGQCCEIDAINKALNAGDSVKGATMGPVKLNESGRVLQPCPTCKEVKSYFELKEVKW